MNDDLKKLENLISCPNCGRSGHDWGEWHRNYREGGWTRYCQNKNCGKFQRRYSDPNEVAYREERWW